MLDLISYLKETAYFGNSLLKYCIDAVILIAGFAVLTIIRRIILTKILKITEKTSMRYDDVLFSSIRDHIVPFCYFLILYFCIFDLLHVPKLIIFLKAVIIIIGIFFVIRFIISLISAWLDNAQFRGDKSSIPNSTKTVIITTAKIILWIIGFLILLDNLGIKVSAFIAGLGIGGIAIAFAAQAVLVDIFSYFSIFFDKPFEVGDLISVNDLTGTVEHIGIKTTHIRNIMGEQVIMPNTSLTGSKLHNFKRMTERRMNIKLDVTYDTTYALLSEIPGVIKNIVEQTSPTRFGSCFFTEFMDSSLHFEIIYYVLSSDFAVAREIQQTINLNIKKTFEEMGIEFAFPTQTLYITK